MVGSYIRKGQAGANTAAPQKACGTISRHPPNALIRSPGFGPAWIPASA
jgi:hypothetical protein